MSTTIMRQNLVQELNETSQRLGNLTILFTNAVASKVNLSATEFECLSLLQEGPLPAGRLAELCGLTTGAMTGLIDRLEKAGYARRDTDLHDRRKVIVVHKEDPKLHKQAVELYRPLEEAFNELTDRYSVQDLKIILGYLQSTNTILEKLTIGLHQKEK